MIRQVSLNKMAEGSKTRCGIAAAGTWLRDRIIIVNNFPREEALVLIEKEREGNGGGPYNLLVNLSLMGAEFARFGLGMLGRDTNAEAILADCRRHGIDASGLLQHDSEPTSYTIVISVHTTGKRTFFHYQGSNSYLDEAMIDTSKLTSRYFYLGYLGMLDALDQLDPEGETGAARVLKCAEKEGMCTVADLVSLESEAGKKKVLSCLPFVDILFLNELEAGVLLGKMVSTQKSELTAAAVKILELGVRRAVLIHHAGGVIYSDHEGNVLHQGSVRLPESMIKGAAGAGDALASGVLFGLHENWEINASLELGVCVAAMSLRSPSCSEGIASWQECLEFGRQRGYRQ